MASSRYPSNFSSLANVAPGLGGHPKPASRGHLKTGQLQAASQDISFYLSRGRTASFLM